MVAARNLENDNINLVQAVGLPMKMVNIMRAVGNVAKGGRNDFQKYDFVQSDDVLDAVRVEMVKNNVVLFPRMVGYEQTAETKGFHAVVQFEFTLIDADSGETLSGTWYGEASDSGDKSFSKAGTSALKYWLLKTFLISANEPDADKDSPDHDHDNRSAQSKLRGNGQQQRRIPPKSNENGSNSNATGNNASSSPVAKEWTANAVIVRVDKNDKPYLQFQCDNGKPTLRGRDMLRTAGYDVETWTDTGTTYDIVPPAKVTVEQNGNFWNVVAIKKTEVVF